jgi:transketolase
MIELFKEMLEKQTFDFRDAVFNTVEAIIEKDQNTVILTNDMGAMGLDKISKFAPDRVINVGITEQNMVGVAAGLALSGKIVFVYGILSHVVFRALEQIKLDVCVQNLPVIFIGVGSGLAYGVDGPTHQGIEDIAILRALPNMTIFNPSDVYSATYAINRSYENQTPCFIRIDKENLPQLYTDLDDLSLGLIAHEKKDSAKGIIFGTGMTVWPALKAAEILGDRGIECNVVDIFEVKPLNEELLRSLLIKIDWVLVVEESLGLSSLSELIAKLIIESSDLNFYRSLNLGNSYLMGSAKREWAWKKFNLDAESIVRYIDKSILGISKI